MTTPHRIASFLLLIALSLTPALNLSAQPVANGVVNWGDPNDLFDNDSVYTLSMHVTGNPIENGTYVLSELIDGAPVRVSKGLTWLREAGPGVVRVENIEPGPQTRTFVGQYCPGSVCTEYSPPKTVTVAETVHFLDAPVILSNKPNQGGGVDLVWSFDAQIPIPGLFAHVTQVDHLGVMTVTEHDISGTASIYSLPEGQYTHSLAICLQGENQCSYPSNWVYHNQERVFGGVAGIKGLTDTVDDPLTFARELNWTIDGKSSSVSHFNIRTVSPYGEITAFEAPVSMTLVQSTKLPLTQVYGLHRVLVSACAGFSCGLESNIDIEVRLQDPDKPTVTGNVPGVDEISLLQVGNQHTISWGELTLGSGITHRNLYRRVHGGDHFLIEEDLDLAGGSVTRTDLMPAQYKYYLKSCRYDRCGKKGFNSIIEVGNIPVPANVSATPLLTNGSLSGLDVDWSQQASSDWNRIGNAVSSYQLTQYAPDGSISGPIIVDRAPGAAQSTELAADQYGEYRIEITACLVGGNCSPLSETTTEMAPPQVQNLRLDSPAVSLSGDIDLSWDAVSGPSIEYRLLEDFNMNGFLVSDDQPIPGSLSIDLGRNPADQGAYRFQVMACSNGYCGSVSNTVEVVVGELPRPEAPVQVLLREDIDPNQIQVMGNYPTPDANQAAIYETVRWTQIQAQDLSTGQWIPQTTLSHPTGIANSTFYSWFDSQFDYGTLYYRVRACNAANECGAWRVSRGDVIDDPAENYCDLDDAANNRNADFTDLSPGQWRVTDMPDQGLDLYWAYRPSTGNNDLVAYWYTFARTQVAHFVESAPIWLVLSPNSSQPIANRNSGDILFFNTGFVGGSETYEVENRVIGRYSLVFDPSNPSRAQMFWSIDNPVLGTFDGRTYSINDLDSTRYPLTNAPASSGYEKVYQIENLNQTQGLTPPSGIMDLSAYSGLYQVGNGSPPLANAPVGYSEFFHQDFERYTVPYFTRVSAGSQFGMPIWVRGRKAQDPDDPAPLNSTFACLSYHKGYHADLGPDANYVDDEERQQYAGFLSRYLDPIRLDQTEPEGEKLRLTLNIFDMPNPAQQNISSNEFYQKWMVKSYGTNDIWFELPGTAASATQCERNVNCQVDVMWKTHPGVQSTPQIYLHRINNGSEVNISAGKLGDITLYDQTFASGQYTLRIRTGGVSSTLLAESDVLTVTGGGNDDLSAPRNLSADGELTTAPFDYTLTWSAPLNGSFAYYVLEEKPPGQATFGVVSDQITSTSFQFSKQAEDAGSYRYRVKACPTVGDCSLYAPGSSGLRVDLGAVSNGSAETPPDPLSINVPSVDPVSQMVGQTRGTFEVAQTGAATYTIPIMTVPGTADLAPEASLSYSSQTGPGTAGTGWTLDAMSLVTRCGQTVEQDGRVRGVRMDSSDRFCLDGERLMMTSSNNPDDYGHDGVQYRTEIDNFTRVTSFGNVGGSPRYFKVERKDGTTSFYGEWCFPGSPVAECRDNYTTKSSDALIASHQPSGAAYAWAIDWFQDSAANYYYYKYVHSSDPVVDFYLRRIDFTGHLDLNPSDGNDTKQLPYAHLKFDYEALPTIEQATSYEAGVAIRRGTRLAGIRSFGENAVMVRYYALNYDPNGDGHGRSRLTSVVECRNSTQSTCYEALEFDWADNQNIIVQANRDLRINNVWPGNYVTGSPGDINGDGLQDMMIFSKENVSGQQVRLSAVLSDPNHPQMAQRVISSSISDHIFGDDSGPSEYQELREQLFTVGDYNTDSFQDLIYAGEDDNRWHARYWSGVSNNFSSDVILGRIVPITDSSYDIDQLKLVRQIDFNGDGLADLLFAYGSTLYISLHQGMGSAAPYDSPEAIQYFIDLEHSQPGFVAPAELVLSLTRLQLLDYNGDGAVDILTRVRGKYCEDFLDCIDGNSRSESDQNLAKKQGYLYGQDELPPTISGSQGQIAHYNAWHVLIADGQGGIEADIALLGKQGADCDAFIFPACQGLARIGEDNHLYLPDMNGDGLSDLVYRVGTDESNTWHYRLNRGTNLPAEGSVTANDILTDPIYISVMHRDSIGDVRFDDIDGNGYTDILFIDDKQNTDPTHPAPNTEEKWQIIYNHANGLVSTRDVTTMFGGDDGQGDQSFFMDFNGDGRLDQIFVNRNSDQETRKVWLNLAHNVLNPPSASDPWSYHVPMNMITEFRSGVDLSSSNIEVTQVEYGAMTQRSLYSRLTTGGTANFGNGSVVFDIVPNGYAVQSAIKTLPHVQVEDGLLVSSGTQVETRFHYHGAKLQGGGRGYLGFAEVIAYDRQPSQQGLLTVSRNRQDFPYMGRTYETVQFHVANEALLPWNVYADGDSVIPCTGSNCDPVIPPQACAGLYECLFDDPNGSAADLIRVSHQFNEWDALDTLGNAQFVYTSRSVQKNWSPNPDGQGGFDAPGPVSGTLVNESLNYDAYGNPRTLIDARYDGDIDDGQPWTFRKQTTDTFDNDLQRWHLGLKRTSTEVSQRPGKANLTRVMAYEYDVETGIQDVSITEPNTEFELRTDHVINELGLKTRTIETSREQYASTPMLRQRARRIEYDALYRFVDRKFNEENVLIESIVSRNIYGDPTEVRGSDGISKHTAHDTMGKAYFSWSDVGSFSQTRDVPGAGSVCPTGTAWHSIISSDYDHQSQAQAVTPTTWSCFDVQGREIREVTRHFNGSLVYKDVRYNSRGHQVMQSRPLAVTPALNTSDHWTSTEIDTLGRVWRVTLPDGSQTQTDYGLTDPLTGNLHQGRLVRMTNQLGQHRYELKNVLTQNVWVRDALGNSIVYDYDAQGQLLSTNGVLPGDVDKTTFVYNRLGQKTQMTDPDKGLWRYRYSTSGELLCQIDANGDGMRAEYDNLKRVTVNYQYRNMNWNTCSGSNPSISEWTYRSPGQSGYGKVATESQLGFDQDSSGSRIEHEVLYQYDGFGRVTDKETRISEQLGSTTEVSSFFERTTYDEVGRIFQNFDASDVLGSDVGSRYVYNRYGYLQQVREAAAGALDPIDHCYQGSQYVQCIQAMDPHGNVSIEYAGNGAITTRTHDQRMNRIDTIVTEMSGTGIQNLQYYFDVAGNLTNRFSYGNSGTLAEEFHYDDLNRLLVVDTNPNGIADTGAARTAHFTYDAAGNIRSRSGETNLGNYTYGYMSNSGACQSAGPHAVCQVGGSAYAYDANGNNVSGDGRSIDYTIRNKPWSLSKGNSLTRFWYGSDNKRFLRIDNDTRRTFYVGSVEIVEEAGARIFKRFVASAILGYQNGQVLNEHYLHKDHLGSLDAVTGESVQDPIEYLSFDAFGQRREASQWGAPLGPFNPIDSITTRGYTGHEQIDSMGIIHMNGRIYDPRLGRFLQADPNVQSPTNSQSLNRYSYVLNNPLSYTDPSGFFFKQLFRTVVAAVAAYFTFGAAYAWAVNAIANAAAGSVAFAQVVGAIGYKALAGVAAGIASGFVSGAIAVGTIKGAVKGAFAGAFSGGVIGHYGDTYNASRIVADGIVGGVTEEINGGSFKDGFLNYGLVSTATYINVTLRNKEIAHSERTPGQIKRSEGHRGVRKGIGGGRHLEPVWNDTGRNMLLMGMPEEWAFDAYVEEMAKRGYKPSPLGGHQGGPGLIFGRPYKPGGFIDYVVEGFGGTHDWLNHPIYYNTNGTAKLLTGWRKYYGMFRNGFNVLLATPIAVPSLVPDQTRMLFLTDLDR